MARFYVGQRVKIVRTYNFPSHMGREAQIVGWHHRALTRVGKRYAYYSGWELDFMTSDGVMAVYEEHDLEPIQDPGRQVISWEEMADLWTPEKVGA